jgi:hypothetical protein
MEAIVADVPLAALAIQPPQVAAGGGGTSINPFQAGVDIMRMQQLGNENRQFQLQQWANQGMAEIMSKHPNDEEGGLREILSSPFAPYGGQFANAVRASNQSLATTHRTNLETAKLGGEIVQTGLGGFIKDVTPTIYNAILNNASDDQLNSIFQGKRRQILAGMPSAAQGSFDEGLNGWWQSITANAPTGDSPEAVAARRQYYLSNLHNGLIGSNLTAEDWKQFLGTSGEIETTGPGGVPVKMPIVQVPGGGIRTVPGPSGGPQMYPMPIPPGVHPEDQVPYPAPNALVPGSFNLGGPGFGSPSPAPGAAPGAAQPTPAPSGATPAPTQSQVPSPAPVSSVTDNEGRPVPLWNENTPMVAPSIPGRTTVGGAPAKTPVQSDAEKEAGRTFDEAGGREYDSAIRTLGNLEFIDNGLSRLAHSKFLPPGAAADLRVELSRALNTVGSLTGYGDTVSPEDLATAEGINKASKLLQYTTVTSFFGAQREAAQTISSAGQAVPNLSGSVLGGKLLTEELRAQANRLIDQRRWQVEWRNRNFGSLIGSKEAFDAKFPPMMYSQGVLDKFGMTEKGFKTGDDVVTAVRNGWITQPNGSQILRKTFPNWKPPQAPQAPEAQ